MATYENANFQFGDRWRPNLILRLLAFSLAVLTVFPATTALGQDWSAFDALQGKWSYQDFDAQGIDGCNDPDGQYFAAIGQYRYDPDKNALEFGREGRRAIGEYEFGCTVTAPRNEGSTIVLHAECDGEEGETITGEARISVVDESNILLSLPDTSDQVLSACSKIESATAQQAEALPSRQAGTMINGIALNQTLDEVQRALNGIGMECITSPGLMADVRSDGFCFIFPSELIHSELWEQLGAFDRNAAATEARFGTVNAVEFGSGYARALYLNQTFFNASSMRALEFATAIASKYSGPEGLAPVRGGWSGHAPTGEAITVYASGTSGMAFVVVFEATDGPQFN